MTQITDVWLENRRGVTALGIDEQRPRISWIPATGGNDFLLEYAREGRAVQEAAVTGSRLVPWPFDDLAPRDSGWLRVRGADSTQWSFPVRVEAGIGDDWRADFVSPDPIGGGSRPRPAYLLRARFDLDSGGIGRARLYVTAHGLFEMDINGHRTDDDLLNPGWQSYSHRLTYRTYDVTPLVQTGANTITAWLADGWYRGHVGFDGGVWDAYGTDVSLLAQLEITHADGRLEIVDLNDAWQWRNSPITSTGIYEGESYDATLALPGADDGSAEPGWRPVTRIPRTDFIARIEPAPGPAVRITGTLEPRVVTLLDSGRIRVDFGQNIAGKVRVRVRGERGHTVRIHHAEVLENGGLATRPLREAVSIDSYTCAGTGLEEWTPRFTYHGFRYVELENWPGGTDTVDVSALVTHSDMLRTGWFECSDPRVNQLHDNVVWSMRDNFVDLPTDCPQRDERMGWTGDIQVFAPTALYLYHSHSVLSGWLRDLAAEQWPNGHVPNFVPWIECGFPNFPTAAWGDAAVIVPWTMYTHDGDTRVLADQYESMRRWVDLVDELTGHSGLWNTGFQLGDWLDPAAPPEDPGRSQTDRYLVATAYHARTARILSQVAGILGRTADESRYRAMADQARQAFQDEFTSANGRVVSDTATSIALAIEFDLLPDEAARSRAGARLREVVHAAGHRVSTGFVGTPIICDALASTGNLDSAYQLLLQEELPSWLYPITMGATTIWERWDSMLPDGSVNPGHMTSFNHYALGAIADFLHRTVAGMTPTAPGWREISYAPHVGGGLTHASTCHQTPLGEASCSWRLEGDHLSVRAVVPNNAAGVVHLPDAAPVRVGPGTHEFSVPLTTATSTGIATLETSSHN